MPILYGIAAIAVLSNGFDQVGIDPLLDKQYAIVKQVDPPVAQTVPATDPKVEPSCSPAFAAKPKACDGYNINLDFQSTAGQGGAVTVTGQIASTNGITVNPAIAGQATTAAPVVRDYAVGQRSVISRTYFGSEGLAKLKGMDRKVSVKFTNASAADVLKWLGKQNVNFVANVDNLPKSKVTMNVSNVPLHEALETVAESLGGSWQVKGSTLIFRSGVFTAFPATNFNYNLHSPFGGQDRYMKADPKAFGELKSLNGDMFKSFKDIKPLDGKAFTYKFDDKALKELKGLDGKHYKFDDKAFRELKDFDGKVYKFDDKAFKEMYKFDENQLKALKDLHMKMDGKAFKFDDSHLKALKDLKFDGKAFTFRKIDTEKLLKSLTSNQKDLMKKQGYLKFSDLTEEQRKLIVADPKAEFPKGTTITIDKDGEKLTIKN